MTRGRRRTVLLAGVAVFALVFGAIQLVPYRVTNPPVRQEPPWDSPQTRELAVAACFDCHSNESEPYFFERIAPLSWYITRDVRNGRSKLNFSECHPDDGKDGEDAAEEIREGSMPPAMYTRFGLHADAELSGAERDALARGLVATLANWECEGDD